MTAPLPYACWDILLAWPSVIAAVCFCVQWYLHVWNTVSFVDSSTSSGSNNLSAIHTCCPLSLGGGGGKMWYSQTLGSALYSILFSVQWPIVRLCTAHHHYREKLLWLVLTDALIYKYTNKYLGGILILHPLSKTIAVGSCLFLNILIKQTFRPIFSYCVFYLKTYVKLLIYAAAF